MIAVAGAMAGTVAGFLLQRRQAREQRTWQTTDLARQETLALVQSTSAAFDQREVLLWQERRAVYIRFLTCIDDWIELLRDLRDSGGLPNAPDIQTSDDARQASPLAARHLEAARNFARVDVEMTVIAGSPVQSVLDALRGTVYAAAREALTGGDKIADLTDERGRLVRAIRFELTTSFVGDRHGGRPRVPSQAPSPS
ncbi:hypothetical protein EF903_12215 [Streptomyces sp. WAC05292]|uniref:hypothetical protein n=1 Tax=Streptomyces sp. WAC05292 TaxID=2487418 RepID=UPI000F73CD3C|nr:hypothetical protein [Streptomyces sp. WAC05292]RSS90691.1 hypothetical protein EF903_12215 [Streptomyces sp. WAC05292]